MPTDLLARAQTVAAQALAAGALQPVDTQYEWVAEGGARFVVRTMTSLARKERAQQRQAARTVNNPFLPPDPALFVADLSPTHRCLLNKFNVIDNHLLIVTRAFEPQEAWLTAADLAAAWLGLQAIDGLVFYNGGAVAGASQPHKHLQLVPLPLAPEGPALPIAPLLRRAGAVWESPLNAVALPWRHAFIPLDDLAGAAPDAAAAVLLARYHAQLAALGLADPVAPLHGLQSAPYNLLLTRRWLLTIPRALARFVDISVNALGFAGSIFVRDATQMALVKAHGPLTLLQHVALPR